jgi:hypothetical protein
LRQSLRDYRILAGRFPNDVDYRLGVAMALTKLAAVVLQQDHPKEARELIEESGKIFEDLTKTLGNNAHFQQHHDRYARVRDAIQQHLKSKGVQ